MESNPFKILEKEEIVPSEVKQKVETSIKSAQLLLDISELFSMKLEETISKIFISKSIKK